MPLLARGYRGVGIDLSLPMLEGLIEKQRFASDDLFPLLAIQANLVELEGIADRSMDHGISMFSTLGMISGANHRREFLTHARRIIKPGGRLVLHAHNLWFHLRHPGGIGWMLGHILAAARGRTEFGDRSANYRNIKQLLIHSFRKSELASLLGSSGFPSITWFAILPGATEPVARLPFASSLRAVGWVVVCT